MRECGLKLYCTICFSTTDSVTPYAGVWIEIFNVIRNSRPVYVTPYAGVWIEICQDYRC